MSLPPVQFAMSLALAGLQLAGDESRGTPDKLRGWLHFARSLGLAGVWLNGAMPDLRARELDRSARRELAALLRRHDLVLAGMDLLIPPAHFTDPAHLDRALGAASDAMGLLSDLRALLKDMPRAGGGDQQSVLCLTLPRDPSPAVRSELASGAEKHGVRIADLSWHRQIPASDAAQPRRDTGTPLGHALDPAAALMGGDDPVALVGTFASELYNVRLTDASSDGRCVPGKGRLNIAEMQIALSAWRYSGFVTLDLRGVADQERAAPSAIAAWSSEG
ncbi:MAG: hypothetical protein K2X32_13840 [Phycisphaerales bacterium]|nr:hypothetical protein [Phycisphaerales bacterium]